MNVLRASLGLGPLRHLEEVFLRSQRLILFTAEPLEYPRSDWPASVRLVGPLTWEPPATPPSWLSQQTRPIVLVTASTVYQQDDKLIATTLEALAPEPVTVVATTGALDPTTFDAPANARVEAFLTHSPILKHAACVVSHGGMGITLKALAAGVPGMCCPVLPRPVRSRAPCRGLKRRDPAPPQASHTAPSTQRGARHDPHASRSAASRRSIHPSRRRPRRRRRRRGAASCHQRFTRLDPGRHGDQRRTAQLNPHRHAQREPGVRAGRTGPSSDVDLLVCPTAAQDCQRVRGCAGSRCGLGPRTLAVPVWWSLQATG